MPKDLRQRRDRDRGRALLQARGRRLRRDRPRRGSRTSSPARTCRAARRSPSSWCARSTSRTPSATSSARSARPSWRPSSRRSTRRSGSSRTTSTTSRSARSTAAPRSASRPPPETFFDKHARDLTLAEAALLAGLPQAPSQYNPFRNPRRGHRSAATRCSRRWPRTASSPPAEANDAKSKPLGLQQGLRATPAAASPTSSTTSRRS